MQNIESDAKKELCCIQLVNDMPVLRARLGVSQDEVASKVGISRQTLSSYESRKRRMPWSVCIALVSYFSSNSKTRDMMNKNTYLYELVDEVFKSKD